MKGLGNQRTARRSKYEYLSRSAPPSSASSTFLDNPQHSSLPGPSSDSIPLQFSHHGFQHTVHRARYRVNVSPQVPHAPFVPSRPLQPLYPPLPHSTCLKPSLSLPSRSFSVSSPLPPSSLCPPLSSLPSLFYPSLPSSIPATPSIDRPAANKSCPRTVFRTWRGRLALQIATFGCSIFASGQAVRRVAARCPQPCDTFIRQSTVTPSAGVLQLKCLRPRILKVFRYSSSSY